MGLGGRGRSGGGRGWGGGGGGGGRRPSPPPPPPHPPPPHHPPPPQHPGLLKQAAATGAGVAAGSVVGNAISGESTWRSVNLKNNLIVLATVLLRFGCFLMMNLIRTGSNRRSRKRHVISHFPSKKGAFSGRGGGNDSSAGGGGYQGNQDYYPQQGANPGSLENSPCAAQMQKLLDCAYENFENLEPCVAFATQLRNCRATYGLEPQARGWFR